MQSPTASSLYFTRVLLARTACAADDVAGAISARLEPLLNPRDLGVHYLYRQCCSWCNLCTPRAFTRFAWSWRALPVPRTLLQLVQSPKASGLYSIQVLLAGMNCASDAVAYAVFERLGLLLDPGSPGGYKVCWRYCSLCSLRTPWAFTRPGVLLAGMKCAGDAVACAFSERIEPLLDPGFPGRHEVCRRCCSLGSLQTPLDFTRHGFSWEA